MTPGRKDDRKPRAARPLLAVLVLASVTVTTLDYRGGADSPVQPVRDGVAGVLGPAEDAVATAARPLGTLPALVRRNADLREDIARLEAENANLRTELSQVPLQAHRGEELDGLLRTAKDTGYALVPARVVAMGPAQSFSRTVTIDAGTRAGVHADMTVLNNDGLVGRVLRASRTSATVLLAVDRDSVVGARVAASMKIGVLRGRGGLGEQARLDLQLADRSATPREGDVVLTWGSGDSGPYVAGIPVGTVDSVYRSPREQSTEAVIRPLVDFAALDVVGVVVDAGTKSDRTVIRAGATASAPDAGSQEGERR
jgi:rod shape-determining protein MreC